MIYNESVKDTIVFYDVVRPNFFIENIVDQLVFTEEFRQNQFIENVTQNLEFFDQITKRDSIETVSVSDTLSFQDTNARLVTGTDVYDILIFTQSTIPTADQVLQSLTFIDVISHDHGHTIADVLEFTEEITEWLVSTETVTDTLVFEDSCVNVTEEMEACAIPSYTYRGYIELEYSGIIVRLRTPDFGNEQSTLTAKVINELRSGQHKISKNTVTPDLKKFVVTISYNKEEELLSLRNFLKASMGQEVEYRDYENGSQNVIILNPNSAMVQEDINNRTVTLEMVT